MNLNELRDKAFKNATEHGWHDVERSDEHWLMMVITELAEAVEADRKGKHAFRSQFKINMNLDNSQLYFKFCFECFIKDSVEDELADVMIRCFDLAGLRNIDIKGIQSAYAPQYHNHLSFTENAYNVCRFLTIEQNMIDLLLDERIREAICYILSWCRNMNIGIFWHIDQKMRYNELRPYKHGKNY